MNPIINNDDTVQLQELTQNAYAKKIPLRIFGSDTKSFYGNEIQGHPLCLVNHVGVVDYEPSELVLTARAGTKLREIEALLDSAGQMLAFEPPYFGEEATWGGTVACGFSGPRRPYSGALRDSILGVRTINGKGEQLRFGGKVIKNVAGYDVSRLMAGALGTLGILLDISVKVIPRPQQEMTLVLEQTPEEAITYMNTLAGGPVPLSAAAYIDGKVLIRLSGTQAAVQAAAAKISSQEPGSSNSFWQQLREHSHPFFSTDTPLWRLSLLPGSPMLKIPGDWLIDWGGAQRWLKTHAPAPLIRDAVQAAGGHATLFRRGELKDRETKDGENTPVFHPLSKPLASVHEKLKNAFDPAHILNRHQLYT
jgi:glycolate oxidase FAD binding subunit